jgi:hypothetical protein
VQLFRDIVHTLAEAHTARHKATATGIPLIDGHFRVRHDKIDTNGKRTLRHTGRLHHIGLGRRYAGTAVLALTHDGISACSAPGDDYSEACPSTPLGITAAGPNVHDVAGHL